MKLNNNDDSHNSGLNLLIYNMLLDIESHPAWVCGLKRKTTKSTSNSPFESGDGQNAVIFIGTNDVQKIGFQATYSGQLIKIRLYWVGSWGKWQTFSLT